MGKLLLVGPRTNKKSPEKTGGAIVLFENLLEQLQKLGIEFELIDSNKQNYNNIICAYLFIFFQLVFKQFKCSSISLHSSRDYLFLGPLVILLGKVFNKQTSLRKFGGDAKRLYEDSKFITRKTTEYIYANMDVLYFEIKTLVTFFSNINPNTFWFPNVRDRLIEPKIPRNFKKRFVFISRVIREKGIDQILEASLKLDKSYTIHIYGPISDDKYNGDYFRNYNVQYLGALNSEKVLETLDKYDVLLLPTFFEGEGYPGIIIEAYSLGMPVIATAWQGIVEILKTKRTGILVKPKNHIEIYDAIKYFNNDNYMDVSNRAYKYFDKFKSDIQTKKFLEKLHYDTDY